IPARYAGVGVRKTYTFIEGATSVAETLPGTINAYTAARRAVRRGFTGGWVIALGTNDTADVVVGSTVGRVTRIARMMSVANGEPVLWVDVKSLRASGPYAQTYMQQWNDALRAACARYPNMRIFDWASVAKNRWFISDGIHYTSAGYAARARLIAAALATAFPAAGASPGCVVKLAPDQDWPEPEPEPPPPRGGPNRPLNSRSPAPAAVSAKPLTRPTNGSAVRFHDSW